MWCVFEVISGKLIFFDKIDLNFRLEHKLLFIAGNSVFVIFEQSLGKVSKYEKNFGK